MSISFIVAIDLQRTIGKGDKIPWHLTSDLKRFKSITSGHTVVMGRRTFESIGKPLKNRTNVVLSRDYDLCYDGAYVTDSVDEILKLSEDQEVIVIGGEQIYNLFSSHVEKIYLTVVAYIFEGNVKFPYLDLSGWNVDYKEIVNNDEYFYMYFVLNKNNTDSNISEYKDFLPFKI